MRLYVQFWDPGELNSIEEQGTIEEVYHSTSGSQSYMHYQYNLLSLPVNRSLE